MEIDKRNENISSRVSKKIKDNYEKISKKTNIPTSTLGTIALLLFLCDLNKIDKEMSETFGKDVSMFSKIWDKSSMNYLFHEIKSAIYEAPREDRECILQILDESRRKNNHIDERRKQENG